MATKCIHTVRENKFHFTQALSEKRTICRSQREEFEIESVVANVAEFLVIDPILSVSIHVT